jgi:hypothetical protein
VLVKKNIYAFQPKQRLLMHSALDLAATRDISVEMPVNLLNYLKNKINKFVAAQH